MGSAMLHIQKLTSSGKYSEKETEIQYDYQIESKPVEWQDENVEEKYKFISELSR